MSNAMSGSSMAKFSASRVEMVERLFARLAANYGSMLAQRWEGCDPADVRAEWARRLDGMPAYRISWALEHLPKFAPTLPEFCELCAEAPLQTMQMQQRDVVPTLPRDAERIPTLEERQAHIAKLKALVGKWSVAGSRR